MPRSPPEPRPLALDTASLAAYAGIHGTPDEEMHALRVPGGGLEMESADTNPLAISAVRPPLPPEPPGRLAFSALDEFYVVKTAAARRVRPGLRRQPLSPARNAHLALTWGAVLFVWL